MTDHSNAIQNVLDRPSSLADETDYKFLRDFIYKASGIVLDESKTYLIDARLLPIVRQHNLGTIAELCAALKSVPEGPLPQCVVEAMTTHETFFFRDPAQYEALQSHILPLLLRRRQDSRKLSFWSAAASSGQEAYSLAMLLLEMGLGDWNLRILATDLSSRILERARSGRYSQIEINRGLPARYLVKYFTRVGVEWEIKEQVRRMVEFQPIDLRRRLTGMGPFDVVFCRNVLIYFDVEARRRILREIHGTLYTEGHLLLGSAETTLNLNSGFEATTLGCAVVYEASGKGF